MTNETKTWSINYPTEHFVLIPFVASILFLVALHLYGFDLSGLTNVVALIFCHVISVTTYIVRRDPVKLGLKWVTRTLITTAIGFLSLILWWNDSPLAVWIALAVWGVTLRLFVWNWVRPKLQLV